MTSFAFSNDDDNRFSRLYEDVLVLDQEKQNLNSEQVSTTQETSLQSLGPVVSAHSQVVTDKKVNPLSGPVSIPLKSSIVSQASGPSVLLEADEPWQPVITPFLETPLSSIKDAIEESGDKLTKTKSLVPSPISATDVYPQMAKIAILIDDLGYSRRGMESSLALPVEVALAILPETPFSHKTAVVSQEQKRITLLHAPMESQRDLELGPGGLYSTMTEQELKETLKRSLDSLPGIQGANNHMGSLLTTKPDSMKWVMEILQKRSLFFIDSLTSSDSVAEETAKEHGLLTIRRDVFLDNIRTEKAIDKQFSRLLKLARRYGSVLAIGHPYPETMNYLKKRLKDLSEDGVHLVPLSDVLHFPSN